MSGLLEYQRFIAKWVHPESQAAPVSLVELAEIERVFGIALPSDYKEAIATLGAVGACIELLDAIVDGDGLVADISELLSASEIIECTTQWRELGLPQGCVAFANDCAGRLSCFHSADGAIWFWDHDIQTLEQVAPTFAEWLAIYNAIEPAT